MEPEDLNGFDAVVHMAELSNDPAGQLNPTITYEINHEGSVRLARLAKQAGVKRFVYMSSCSVYGIAEKGFVDEEAGLPQTAYAECRPSWSDANSPDGFLRFPQRHRFRGSPDALRYRSNNLAAWPFSRHIREPTDGQRPLVCGSTLPAIIVAI